MEHFLTGIQINKIFHLENIKIDIDDKEKKHLLITGKNGCGKTSLLNALVEYLQFISDDVYLDFLKLRKLKEDYLRDLGRLGNESSDEDQKISIMRSLEITDNRIQQHFGKVELSFTNIYELAASNHDENFLFAFYQATRKTEVIISKTPEKPIG